MHLKTIQIEGYRYFGNPCKVTFLPGLNVLLGENGCGKTSVIDAIREILLEDEFGRSGIRPTDFHQPFSANASAAASMLIKAELGLEGDETVAFLPWAISKNLALLTLRIENKLSKRGRFKWNRWGGQSSASAFEPELSERLHCIYLPPMRDAEAKLREGRGSRLARLLRNLNPEVEGVPRPLEAEVREFHETLAKKKTNAIAGANEKIRVALRAAVGEVFGQDTAIRFSESNFNNIVENLRLYFFPEVLDDGNHDFFRKLEENSLGYNNLLYLATVLAELSSLTDTSTVPDPVLRILLIEEPEAHLHPQLQILLLKYLDTTAKGAPPSNKTERLAHAIHLWESEIFEFRDEALRVIGEFVANNFFPRELTDARYHWCPRSHDSKAMWRVFLARILDRCVAGQLADFNRSWPQWAFSAKSSLPTIIESLSSEAKKGVQLSFRAPNGKSKELVGASFADLAVPCLAKLRTSTIHAAKGETVEAVLLVSSRSGRGKKGGFWRHWLESTTDEGEHARFAYVASSRPRQFLAWAIPELEDGDAQQLGALGFEPIC